MKFQGNISLSLLTPEKGREQEEIFQETILTLLIFYMIFLRQIYNNKKLQNNLQMKN